MLTQTQRDARKADRRNSLRLQQWQDQTPSLFEPVAPPPTLTATDIQLKRECDQAAGQACLERVRQWQQEADAQADLMREVFAEFKGRYLADLREASISPDLRRYRWGEWERHLHSIGVVAVGIKSDGTPMQVVAEREEGMAVFEGYATARTTTAPPLLPPTEVGGFRAGGIL